MTGNDSTATQSVLHTTPPSTTPPTPTTLVAAVDNDAMALMALRGVLPRLLPESRWLWGVAGATEAIRMALDPQTRPRLLLVDMSLDDGTGVTVCRRIRCRTDRVLLLAVTAFSVDAYAARAAQAGAQGIVSKADMPAMAAALRAVAATANPSDRSSDDRQPRLGDREEETLRLLAQGLSYDQIAAQWDVTPATVRTHAHRATAKLGARSLAHAIALYLSR
ncbi:response regulator transcription factor [Bifidobacterium leontopitheci]|nr:LuxR C-terminal-related transcriptional regulator [Bifidobacterium leontopitheci]